MDTLFDVMRGPTRDVFKEPDASDSSIIAKVKPMLHPTWNVDHVSAFDRHAEDRSTFGVQVEHTFAFDSKTDFVLRVRVLFVELRKHRIEVGGFRMDIDYVGGKETTCGFYFFDFRSVLVEDVCIASGWGQTACNLPVFVPNAEGLQEIRDLGCIGQLTVFAGDMYSGHETFGSRRKGKKQTNRKSLW
jgi:hypothetical protein